MLKKEQQGELRYLFTEARQFRNSEYFRKMMDFCAKMKHLKPFNAMLVYNQMPGAKYVNYPEVWKKEFHRLIKPDARPLVILNFQPVGYVFDLYDTYPDPDYQSKIKESDEYELSDEELLWQIEKQFEPYAFYNNNVDIKQLKYNMTINGIAYNSNFDAGAGYGGHSALLNTPYRQMIEFPRKTNFDWALPFLVSTNKNASEIERISTIVHELGHIYCHHFECPPHWKTKKQQNKYLNYDIVYRAEDDETQKPWQQRILPKEVAEIEAESVSYLVCSRLGIKTKSAQYLAYYIEDKDEIPSDVSYEHIFKAANKIMELFDYMSYKDGMLYKYDADFRKECEKY